MIYRFSGKCSVPLANNIGLRRQALVPWYGVGDDRVLLALVFSRNGSVSKDTFQTLGASSTVCSGI